MTRAEMTDPEPEELADRAAPLDALLVEAALGPLRRFAPDASTVRFALRLARRPRTTGRRLGGLAAELARIGVGTSRVAPSKRDRRFTDPAWTANPLLRRLVQAHLAAGQTAEQVVGDAALGWRDEQAHPRRPPARRPRRRPPVPAGAAGTDRRGGRRLPRACRGGRPRRADHARARADA